MAYAPAGADTGRQLWVRARTAVGRTDRRDSAGRCDLVRAGREALAWSGANDGDDPFCHSREARWQNRGLDGAGERRAIPGIIPPLNGPRLFRDSGEIDPNSRQQAFSLIHATCGPQCPGRGEGFEVDFCQWVSRSTTVLGIAWRTGVV